jgi:hypothetical protein
MLMVKFNESDFTILSNTKDFVVSHERWNDDGDLCDKARGANTILVQNF